MSYTILADIIGISVLVGKSENASEAFLMYQAACNDMPIEYLKIFDGGGNVIDERTLVARAASKP